MNLAQQVKEDIKLAMKLGETQKRDILRLVSSRANLMAKEDLKRPVEERDSASDADMLLAIQRQIKQNKEVIEIYQKEGKDYTKDQQEIDILSVYLPKQMSIDELKELVESIIKEQESKGMVMKELSKYRDNIDMKSAKTMVDGILS